MSELKEYEESFSMKKTERTERCCESTDIRKHVRRGYHVCVNCGLVIKAIFVASSGFEDDLKFRKKSIHNRSKWFENIAREYVSKNCSSCNYVDKAVSLFQDMVHAFGDLKLIKGRNLSNYLWHLKKLCEMHGIPLEKEIVVKNLTDKTDSMYQERFDKAARHLGWIL